MIYILNDEAGEETLRIKGDMHKYLIKVRRHKEGDILSFRSRNGIEVLHNYKLESIEARSALLSLTNSKKEIIKSKKELHIGWCIIDSGSIEKVLPMLCEIGVQKISFITCDRSQKNFKLDFNRFDRIVEASMQQSGRTTYIEFDMYKNIKEFVLKFPDTKVFDFCDNTTDNYDSIKRVLIGCEGGFSPNEREIIKSLNLEKFKLDTPMVLRSESAVVAVAGKIVL